MTLKCPIRPVNIFQRQPAISNYPVTGRAAVRYRQRRCRPPSRTNFYLPAAENGQVFGKFPGYCEEQLFKRRSATRVRFLPTPRAKAAWLPSNVASATRRRSVVSPNKLGLYNTNTSVMVTGGKRFSDRAWEFA